MIFRVDKGIICQQVNCQGAIGVGLSRDIIEKYPKVEDAYFQAILSFDPTELLGKIKLVQVEDELYIASLFTQFDYGNAKKTGICYTDTNKLIKAIDTLAEKFPDKDIYIPAYIGCGLSGGNWNEITGELFCLERPNLFLLDTINEPYLTTRLYIPQLSLRKDNEVKIDPSLYTGRIIAFDTETTGVGRTDEILQISIVNEKEETVLSNYFKPERHISWPAAMSVNNITPEMVKDSPCIRRYIPLLKNIFDKADVIVGHNVAFDIRMLNHLGVEVDKDKTFCTCNYFKKDCSLGRHKLIDAVTYYCPQALADFEGKMHDALPDAIAALRVYLAIRAKKDYYFDFKTLKDPIKGSDISKIYMELNEPEKEL